MNLTVKDLRDWIDVVFKIVVAITGIIVGYWFSFQKQQNDDIKLIVELATATEASKRLMGASIAQTYMQQKRIPQDVYVAVVSYANNSDDRQLQAVVNTGAAQASKNLPDLKKALTKASDALPVRVYFHIRSNDDRAPAEKIKQAIEALPSPDGGAIIVPGIEKVEGTQSRTLLKCFKKIECDTLGPKIVDMFKANGVTMELSNHSATYEQSTSIRPNHFEAWFAPGLPAAAM